MNLQQEISKMREKRKSADSFWNSQVLRIELGQLRREVHHLTLKEQERKLSDFEQKRITQISKEMTKLMDRARKLSSDLTSRSTNN